jgi:endo-1,4-beta-xylanase
MEKYQYHDVNMRGSIKRINYLTTNQQGEAREKYANIYLPYGYEEADKEKKYNIFYVMHGGGGNADAWLDCCQMKNMLDYMIDEKQINPLIVVFPSYYNEIVGRVGAPDRDVERAHVLFFQKELIEDLLPAVEKECNTYAKDSTKEAFKASRMHRGFSGFSMGSATTWFAFLNNMDYFSYYVPLSGDCWELESQGGLNKPDETAKLLHDHAAKSGYGVNEYFIYTATGTEDIAYEALTTQVNAMRKFPDTFVENEDLSKGNFHYLLAEGEVHAYEAVNHYLYNILPYLFK